MSEAEAVLREKAEPFGVFRESYEQREAFVEQDFKLFEQVAERKATKLERVERNLKAVVELQVDLVIDDDILSPAVRLQYLNAIEGTRRVVRDKLIHIRGGRMGEIYPDDLQPLVEFGGGRAEDREPRLWGMIVVSLAKEHGVRAVQAVEMIADIRGVEFGEVFEMVAPMLAESMRGSQYEESTNDYIERKGYIWSGRLNKYVKYEM